MRLELWVTKDPACCITEFRFCSTRLKLGQVMTNVGFQVNFSGYFMKKKTVEKHAFLLEVHDANLILC